MKQTEGFYFRLFIWEVGRVKWDLASCMHALLCVIPMAAHSHGDTAADEVPSVNKDDENAFQENEVEEEAVNEWLALFHSDTDDEYFEGF